MPSVNFAMKKRHNEQLRELKMRELRNGNHDITSSAVVRKYINHALDRLENGDILCTKNNEHSKKHKLQHISIPKDTYLRICKVRAEKISRGRNVSEAEIIERLFEMGYKHRWEL